MSEWLRSRTRNPMGSARGGSNPLAVAVLHSERNCSAISFWMGKVVTDPNIAQLVERSTVDVAVIEWSLVRFRVFGYFADFGLVSGTGYKFSVVVVASLV